MFLKGILDPRDTYADVNEWTEKAKSLAAKYIKILSNTAITTMQKH